MSYIILDRDGVINFESEEYIKSPEEWKAIPGSLEAIAQLNRSGYKVFLVTNQSGVARGYYDLDTLTRIHEKMIFELAKVGGIITDIFYCAHHPDEHCSCRKPKPGMLYQIEEKYGINLRETFFIGDSYSDIQAAKTAGCMPLLVLTGNGQRTIQQHSNAVIKIPVFENLLKAVDYVLEGRFSGDTAKGSTVSMDSAKQ